jgi:glycosyltransferase involved in cell wall biosynthesis
LPGNFLLKLAVALRAGGTEVQVLAPHAPGLELSGVVDGIPVTRFRYAPDVRETLAYGGTMAAQFSYSWRARFYLARFLNSASRGVRALASGVDVVHAHWWIPAGLAATRRSLRGRPLVTTLHGSDVRLARSGIAAMLMRRVLTRSTRVTAVSRWLASESALRARVRVPDVAPMPVATDLFAPRDVERHGLVFVGKLDAQKGVRVLLDALALLPQPVNATIIGGGADAGALQARATTLGLAGRVRWLGALPHAELAQHFQRAQLCIAPATEPEGLGLTAAESLLCETPVVASNIGGLPDVVENGVTGRLVKPNDPSTLATAITESLADAPRLAAWGREGRARALSRFDPAVCAARYREIYEQAVRERRP